MFKLFFNILFLACFAYSKAMSMEELKQKYVDIIIKCSENYALTAPDVEQLKNKVMPDNESTRCLFACVYKEGGMMNDKGELWIDGVNELTRKYLSNDPEKIKKSEEFAEACKSVNDVPVSDGSKGCERAALIFKCTVEKAPDFDFV